MLKSRTRQAKSHHFPEEPNLSVAKTSMEQAGMPEWLRNLTRKQMEAFRLAWVRSLLTAVVLFLIEGQKYTLSFKIRHREKNKKTLLKTRNGKKYRAFTLRLLFMLED